MNKFSAVAVARAFRRQAARLVLTAGVAAALAAGIAGGGGARAAVGSSAPAGMGPAVFSRLSCEGDSFCLATGTYHKTGGPYISLLEAWNGKVWRAFPKPRYFDNNDVTCGAWSFCLAGTAPPKARKVRTVDA